MITSGIYKVSEVRKNNKEQRSKSLIWLQYLNSDMCPGYIFLLITVTFKLFWVTGDTTPLFWYLKAFNKCFVAGEMSFRD